MRIVMPSRILDKNVGGNTTYAREIASRLVASGHVVDRLGSGKNPISTMIAETWDSRRTAENSVVHFVADTGPFVSPRMPAVVTVHGVASRWISTARNRVQEYVWRTRVEAAIRACDQVITVSESSADDICNVFGVERKQISVIPHGITHSRFEGGDDVSLDVKAQLPDEFLLYVGNIEPRKNLIELIHAVEANTSLPQLVIAGKPAWNYGQTMNIMANASRVIYLGFVSDEDRTALMKRCIAFVFPSLYEGFGFPVLEAMAAGAPVITTNRGSLQEIAGPSWILEDTDRVALSLGIEAALADTSWQQRVLRDGQDWVRRFSWDQSVAKHLSIYRGLVA
ncbi:glycosyltransferase family 1 protein [Pseudarthrobacter sp. J75]|uniref:glycosyltransferase family 4 protein n=1 Tax=unclassified Pseudarthrobacter TaxID=2647000 RepID=UPI002E81CF59|nr:MULTISPECIES: glycosyltransferase family 1 protein [unclassified Pseudarthrobacter]MEE2524681.1 glycosyltransferase family 1 protein [Pseudarthrobacter sp. J47]MEE2528231.1 glycosyltransferase family 1 protein [Pseudarthrobacter sp. J75]